MKIKYIQHTFSCRIKFNLQFNIIYDNEIIQMLKSTAVGSVSTELAGKMHATNITISTFYTGLYNGKNHEQTLVQSCIRKLNCTAYQITN